MNASGSRLPYFRSLDGLRGVSVAAVLAFHAGFSWAVGGYLGVSTFFTLSGFLITGLLLDEREGRGSVRLRHFWSRRFRRLMPASLAALGLAVLYGATIAEASQVRELRGDVLSALAYVANWRFLLDDTSYADLFTAPSPVLQFWSLAIEEQFYLLFPLITVAVLRLGGAPRRTLALAFTAITALSFGLAVFGGWSDERIYFGTDTRASELLVGAVLAVAVTGRRLDWLLRSAAALTGMLALFVMVALLATTSQTSSWLYEGGFTLYALISALVILAATQPRGLVPSVLSLQPLVALGRISYGVYLYHWLVFLWLTPSRTGLSQWPLFGLRVAVTLAIATVSYHLLEQPIRERRFLTDRQVLAAGPVTAGVLVAGLLLVTISPPAPLVDLAAAQDVLDGADIPPVPPAEASGDADDLAGPPAPRIAVFGDSTALVTATGLYQWTEDNDEAVQAGGAAWLGCGVARGGQRRAFDDDPGSSFEHCENWELSWSEAITTDHPDLAVVQIGPWEITDRLLPGDDIWRGPGDDIYDDWLVSEFLAATDLLSSEGARVVWLTSPPIGVGESGAERDRRGDIADPARMQRVNELIRIAATKRPDETRVVDLAGWVAAQPDDPRLRPDGVHFSNETAAEVAEVWLGPELVRIHREEWVESYVAEHGSVSPDPLRVLTIGDSTSAMLSIGLGDWARDTRELWVSIGAEVGCGIVRGGHTRYHNSVLDQTEVCPDWADRWPQYLEDFDPHVVVILAGPFDVADRRLDEGDPWRAPGDPMYDEFLAGELAEAAEVLTSSGALLVWLTTPYFDVGRADISRPSTPYPASDPARADRLNALVADVAEANDSVVTLDLAGWLEAQPGGALAPHLRPDGVHLTIEAAYEVAQWLGPETKQLFADWLTTAWLTD